MKTCTTHTADILDRSTRFLAAMLTVAFMVPAIAVTQSPAPVTLGSASDFAVLASSTVTSTGATTITGDLGVSPGTAVTGSPTVNGTIHAGDGFAALAQLDLTIAYNDAAGRTVGAITIAGNLGGQTLVPGLYTSTSSLEISSGDLTLDAKGDPNAVFIFQMASTLTTTTGCQVILSGGASASTIFWQVGSSATLGTTSVFKGNILALASVTLATGATLDGRALARTGAVTLDGNTVTMPPTTPLAVQLVSFTASIVSGTSVRLDWMTISETNNFGFYVERKRATESSFSSVPNSFVPGHGTTLEPLQYSFTDNSVPGVQLKYRLKQVDLDGTIHFTDPIAVSVPTSVNEQLAAKFKLEQNYPNPFNPSTKIEYSLEKAAQVSLKVYNLLGQEIATLVNDRQEAGSYTVPFNTNRGTLSLSSGVYFYRLEAGSFISMRKLTLMK